MLHSSFRTILLIFLSAAHLFVLQGCASVMVGSLTEPVTQTFERETDINLLRRGAPTLLLLTDSLIRKYPDNTDLLLAGARSYSFYTTVLDYTEDREAAAGISEKAKTYGFKLLDKIPALAGKTMLPADSFQIHLAGVKQDDIDNLFWGAQAVGNWIIHQQGSPASLVELPKFIAMLEKVIELDDRYYYGFPQAMLGAYYGSTPRIAGGDPELSRHYFERALKVSDRKFLLIQVLYAESYARMKLDRELYTQLLQEVIKANGESIARLSAINSLAKIRAGELITQTDDIF